MPRLFWASEAGLENNQLGFLNDAGQLPARSSARTIEGSDVVYPAPGGGLLRVPVGGGVAAPINGSANGQLWYYDQSAGLWVPTSSAPADNQTIRWNAALNRYDFVEYTAPGDLTPFDLEGAQTLALYDFSSGTYNDSSGNGQTLTNISGTVGFSYVYPGKLGAALGSNTALLGPIGTAAGIAGDITIEVIAQLTDDPSTPLQLLQYAGLGETEAANAQWGLGLPTMSVTSATSRRLTWTSEHGAGIDDTYTSGGTTVVGWIHNVAYFAGTRAANVIQPYYMGEPMGPPSAALTAPTGGSTGRICIGSVAGTSCVPGIYYSARVTSGAKSAAEIKASYNRTMGPAFGRRP